MVATFTLFKSSPTVLLRHQEQQGVGNGKNGDSGAVLFTAARHISLTSWTCVVVVAFRDVKWTNKMGFCRCHETFYYPVYCRWISFARSVNGWMKGWTVDWWHVDELRLRNILWGMCLISHFLMLEFVYCHSVEWDLGCVMSWKIILCPCGRVFVLWKCCGPFRRDNKMNMEYEGM